jgi:hypothetical protein
VSPQAPALASALVILVLALGFDAYCLSDLARARVVLGFPPQVWLGVILLSTPFGGIAYLMLGRPR